MCAQSSEVCITAWYAPEVLIHATYRTCLVEVEGISSLLGCCESHCVTTWRDAWCSASLSCLSSSPSSPPPDVSILTNLSWCAPKLSEPQSQHRRHTHKLTAGLTKVLWNEFYSVSRGFSALEKAMRNSFPSGIREGDTAEKESSGKKTVGTWNGSLPSALMWPKYLKCFLIWMTSSF